MKKGFTLIELLAVILIISLVGMIAVPTVMVIIENSKKQAAEVSTVNYLRIIDQYISLQDPDDGDIILKDNSTYYLVVGSSYDLIKDNKLPVLTDVIKYDGPLPKDGYVKIGEGAIEESMFVYNDYEIKCNKALDCNTVGKVDKKEEDEKETEVVNNDGITKVNIVSDDIDYYDYAVGMKINTNVTYEPSDKITTFTYYSSNDEIASIDDKGVITVNKIGNCKIYARSASGVTGSFNLIMDIKEPVITPSKIDNIMMTKDGYKASTNEFSVKFDDMLVDYGKAFCLTDIDSGEEVQCLDKSGSIKYDGIHLELYAYIYNLETNEIYSDITVSSSYEIEEQNDISILYDDDYSSTVDLFSPIKIYFSNDLKGKKFDFSYLSYNEDVIITFYNNSSSKISSATYLYDEDRIVNIDGVELFNEKVTIPNDAYYMVISSKMSTYYDDDNTFTGIVELKYVD